MDEPNTTGKDTNSNPSGSGLQAKENIASDGKDGTSEAKTRTYTQEEHLKEVEKAVSDALMKQGRTHKSVLTATEKKAETRINEALADVKAENEKLQQALDEMAVDDEDKTRLTKLLKENTTLQKDLQKQKNELAPQLQAVREHQIATACLKVSGDFEGADPVKLERLARKNKDVLEAADDEAREDSIREIAEDLYPKKGTKAEVKKEEPRHVDSGVTMGKGETDEAARLKARYPSMYK